MQTYLAGNVTKQTTDSGMPRSFIGYCVKRSMNEKDALLLLRPVAQLYGQVRTDWNQCFIIDSLSHPAGHKPFTCSHSVLR